MIIKILGIAPGGRFPQWNCNGHNSRSVCAGKRGCQLATESSILVSGHRDAGGRIIYNAGQTVSNGLSHEAGRRTGLTSINGADRSISALSGLGIGRRVFVHISNSKPVLNATSEARKLVEATGLEIADGGMEIEL